MATTQPSSKSAPSKGSFPVLADVMILPLGDNGTGSSISKYVASAIEVLRETPGLKTKTHANGTNLEGDYDTVMDLQLKVRRNRIRAQAIKRCHQKLHEMGVVHTNMTMKLGTRTDKEGYDMDYKVARIEQRLKDSKGA